jgi:ribosomal protein S27E
MNSFKNDRYKKIRGGYSRFLDVRCQKCAEHICYYQKDGPGNLRRMYCDRIIKPKVSILRKNLSCSKNHLLGVKIIYDKEKRPAFRLFVDSVTKKIIRLV